MNGKRDLCNQQEIRLISILMVDSKLSQQKNTVADILYVVGRGHQVVEGLWKITHHAMNIDNRLSEELI